MKKITLISLGVATLLSGCASVSSMSSSVEQRVQTQTQKPIPQQSVVQTVRSMEPSGRAVDVMDDRKAVNIDVSNAHIMPMIDSLAKRMGYGSSALSSIDVNKRVTARFRAATVEQAIRQLAWHSGYVAVINHTDKTVTLANEATMVFRVPSADLKKMMNTNFKFGGNPIGGGGGGGSGGESSNFAPVSSDFTVQGNFENNPEGFKQFVEELAGANAQVKVLLEAGLVSVRSNGQALKRVHDFLSSYAYDARRQVEISAKVVEVGLGNEFRYGIQWDKVADAGRKNLGINNLSMLGAVSNPNTLRVQGASTTSIVQALETLTDVEVTSTPQLIVSNNSSGVIFEGLQKPYIPSVTATTTDGTTTYSGAGAYASDGIQMAVHAQILDDTNAVLTVVPSTVALGELKRFLNDQVQMYEQSIRNGGQRVAIRSGETIVISGNRYTRANNTKRGLPGIVNVPVAGAALGGVGQESSARQTVIIMTARILRPDAMDIVFSESI